MVVDNFWEKRYQSGETGWDRGETSANLLHWIKHGLIKPCRILIPGCGNGHEVVTLAELGFDVVAIDIASMPLANLAKKLAEKELNAELIQTDFFIWHTNESFDAIYTHVTSICMIQSV